VRRNLRYAIAVSLTLGAIVGSGMVWIALQHNPQEIYLDMESGAIHYRQVLPVFFSWFVAVFVAVAVVELAVYVLGRLVRIWK
jgi:phosphate/sulfate permease